MTAAPEAAATPILEARGLVKDFRGFRAVDGVDLRVRSGSIHALIGPNGAGKSTVFNLLARSLEPSGGQIWFRGEDITRMPPARVARKGLGRSFQISSIFPHLTVLENVRIALQRPLGWSYVFWRTDRALGRLEQRADELIASVGLTAHRDDRAVELSYGRRRALEFATTLAMEPALLLLDEPMAGLGLEDIERIAALVRQAASGRTVLMVEHNLDVVADLSDTITVLARGRVLAEGAYREIAANEAVRAAYIGEDDG